MSKQGITPFTQGSQLPAFCRNVAEELPKQRKVITGPPFGTCEALDLDTFAHARINELFCKNAKKMVGKGWGLECFDGSGTIVFSDITQELQGQDIQNICEKIFEHLANGWVKTEPTRDIYDRQDPTKFTFYTKESKFEEEDALVRFIVQSLGLTNDVFCDDQWRREDKMPKSDRLYLWVKTSNLAEIAAKLDFKL